MINLSSVLEVASATHPGMVRSHNEDSIATDAEIGLAVLADGMGGYNAGEVASGIAVELIRTEMKKSLSNKNPEELDGQDAEQLIEAHATRANTAIYQASQSQPHYSGMGTTLVVALWHDNRSRSGTSATRGFTGCAAARWSRLRATILCCRNRSIAA